MRAPLPDAARASRLARVFRDFLKGRSINTTKDAQLLLEAIRAEPSPSSCLESIVVSDSALQAVKSSVRTDTSAQYIISHVMPFLAYFATPEVKSIQGGQMLRQFLLAIIQPPTAWNAMVELYTDQTINGDHEETFAWLCLEIVRFAGPELGDIVAGLSTALSKRPLLESTSARARELGYNIDKVLKMRHTLDTASDPMEDSPGGRHDNDFADFRQIAILPTRDELSSTSPPFLRRAAQFLQKNKNVVRHQAFGALCRNNEVVGFAFIVRDIDLLIRTPPVVGLQFTSSEQLTRAAMALGTCSDLKFVLVDTPIFAYRPILQRLQDLSELPLERELLRLPDDNAANRLQAFEPSPTMSSIISAWNSMDAERGRFRIGARNYEFDRSQLASILNILRSGLSLIQGPPGVPADDMTRLGAKFSDASAPISFENQLRRTSFGHRQMGGQARVRLSSLRKDMDDLHDRIDDAFRKLVHLGATATDILDFLEFSDQWQMFYSAFQVPEAEDGFTIARQGGKELTSAHLYEQWRKGQTPTLREEQAALFSRLLAEFNAMQTEADAILGEGRRLFIQSKRVIACTTTGAAMYSSLLKAAKPNVVLVEEAGEILEAHVLSALHSETKQVVLIGDHKQLRPKISNYSLSVEYGEGYDLNMSLFERLIRQGHPYTTLHRQRRMVPEISQLIREMTYPELIDDETTLDRPLIRGLQGRVVFVNHDKPEIDATTLRDRRDTSVKASKQNEFEARLVLKLVRYLGQQGYRTEDIVVLTPYFGQLSMLRDALSLENDPVLNDLDSAELIRAGLSTYAAGQVDKGKIKLSTIDNYQGEESDIVIASLTRSNNRGDIGFMKEPERLNVLVSRARNCLIMIGNMDTFMSSNQGKHVWVPFFKLLKEKGYLQDGIPIHCDRHPDTKAILSTPEDFELHCPDGGCAEPCGTMLSCGIHVCQRRCHRIADHSKIARERRLIKEQHESEEQQRILQQHHADLAELKKARDVREAMANAQKAAELCDTKKRPSHDSKEESGKLAGSDIIQGSARDEWEQMKKLQGEESDSLDALMDMIGMEAVKQEFLSIKNRVDTALRQSISLRSERLGCSLLGNPGTGNSFTETTGSKLASMGVTGCQQMLDEVLDGGGGVIFIDEAYQLSSGNSPGGRAVLDFLLAEVENLTGKIVFVLAGYTKQMESFFAHNPGLPSRFPIEMKFADYTDGELLQILERQVNRRFGGRMKAEDGLRGLYCRIVCRRLGRGRGKDGFGNARAVENAFSRICARQANRLRRQRYEGKQPDDLLLTKEDLIGPEPSNALLMSESWTKLQALIGLDSVKDGVKVLLDTMQTNYHRELEEQPIVEYTLNRVFLGNPGTGKTTVAKLYGQILVDLGMLSNGEVIIKSPADFVGSVLGQSEQQTKGILAATAGKVLVIDEAYGLYGGVGSQSGVGVSDPYKTAVVDTIVSEVQSTPGDDRCVLLLGYRAQMEEMFQNVNPGLTRRFPLSSAFVFEDFDDQALRQILDLKLKQQGFQATGQAKKVVLEMLDRARNRPHFGNAGEIDILLNEAKSRHQKRESARQTTRKNTLEAVDFDENFDRAERSDTNVSKLFVGTVGCEKIIATLEGYQQVVRTMRELDMDPKEHVPFNFLFRGPPGTGKTSTARRMGKVFYDMGFLASAEVIDCSATDLIGQYVGQTGPKVQQLLDKALGRVLLIDEAYRLCEGHFAKEALDEIVDAVTKEKYYKKLIIILAGYEEHINLLLNVNPGMTSRFPETIDFHSLSPQACFDLLATLLQRKKKVLGEKNKSLDLSCIEQASSGFREQVMALFTSLSSEPNWASARDVETLVRSVFTVGIRSKAPDSTGITITEDTILGEMKKMLAERENRGRQAWSIDRPKETSHLVKPASPRRVNPTPLVTTNTTTVTRHQYGVAQDEVAQDDEASSTESLPPTPSTPRSTRLGVRDHGVSDEVWEQLQLDAEAEEQQERNYQAMLEKKKKAREDDEERRRIVRQLIEEEDRRKREAEAKRKLEVMGLCPMGYCWIKQSNGYRCAGGSHFISGQELADL
ncbi:hypothetical protein ACRALDRAFT_1049679 [Sodiomyces alcalophilus JCM 7366]|uniref:uncharacterized protein n=1 Tax=Sodiomyces alcalophilus JCM 7366 TaxID=591952 RepID=UPI0039B496E4